MTIQSWLMYLVLVLAATSTPGPAVLFIMTNSALHGWKKTTFAALGNIQLFTQFDQFKLDGFAACDLFDVLALRNDGAGACIAVAEVDDVFWCWLPDDADPGAGCL